MSASTTSHGQSGFMSVESIGNALFYLIMIGIAALVVSVVMKTGKGGGDLAAISMTRSNVQYIGTNGGSYTGVGGLKLADIVDLISITTISGIDHYTLPSGHKITIAPVGTTQFNIRIENVSSTGTLDRDLCRKYAYFGIGSNFESVDVNNGGSNIINEATMIGDAELGCGAVAPPEFITLLSN